VLPLLRLSCADAAFAGTWVTVLRFRRRDVDSTAFTSSSRLPSRTTHAMVTPTTRSASRNNVIARHAANTVPPNLRAGTCCHPINANMMALTRAKHAPSIELRLQLAAATQGKQLPR
jgi:hypothetical protein